jgi:hypothetical protein
VLAREGASLCVSATFCEAVVQSVLLRGCEIWAIASGMLSALESFHHRVARRLTLARQNGCHSNAFRVSRGMSQGDIVSPTIFNTVADAVARHWFRCLVLDANQGNGNLSEPETTAGFCADDGVTAGHHPEQIQQGLDLAVELFERVSLESNAAKTKAVVCHPGSAQSRISSPACERRFEGGPTHSARKRHRVLCHECGKSMQQRHLPNYLLHQHGVHQDVSAAGSAGKHTGGRLTHTH